jgi:hypothetical protein
MVDLKLLRKRSYQNYDAEDILYSRATGLGPEDEESNKRIKFDP